MSVNKNVQKLIVTFYKSVFLNKYNSCNIFLTNKTHKIDLTLNTFQTATTTLLRYSNSTNHLDNGCATSLIWESLLHRQIMYIFSIGRIVVSCYGIQLLLTSITSEWLKKTVLFLPLLCFGLYLNKLGTLFTPCNDQFVSSLLNSEVLVKQTTVLLCCYNLYYADILSAITV